VSNSGATSCHNHWDDHDIRVVFDQHASLYFHSARSLKQQSTGRYVYSSRTHYTDCKPISLCKNKLNSWMYFTESWFVLDQYDKLSNLNNSSWICISFHSDGHITPIPKQPVFVVFSLMLCAYRNKQQIPVS
jgi:hypothetical protein